MTREQVQAWLDAYVSAWRSYDGIGDLFSQDATSRCDEGGQTFSNLFVLEFDGEGRCSGFTEWFMEHPM